MSRPSDAYTGEPDMPAQTPPARVSAGELRSAMIMSTPGAMPSVIRPRTLALNGAGVVPRSTVKPVPTTPSTACAVGNASGHATGAVTAACAAMDPGTV